MDGVGRAQTSFQLLERGEATLDQPLVGLELAKACLRGCRPGEEELEQEHADPARRLVVDVFDPRPECESALTGDAVQLLVGTVELLDRATRRVAGGDEPGQHLVDLTA